MNIAIIPVRTGSKRVPKKNIRDFFGKPLFIYTMEYARDCGLFEDVVLSTESQEVINIAQSYGFDVPFQRPVELATDQATVIQVCDHTLNFMHQEYGKVYDNFCMLQATSPMRTDRDIIKAFELLDESADAVVAVTDYNIPPLWAFKYREDGYVEYMFPEYMCMKSQQLPKVCVDSGAMYWIRVSAFRDCGHLLPPRLKPYWMPRHAAVDVDEPEDWTEMQIYYREYFLKENV